MAGEADLKRAARVFAKAIFAIADFPFTRRPGPRILVYHQIGSGLGRQMEVTERAFAFHLRWLREHGDIVSLEEAMRRRGEPEAHRLFVLTFDDGFSDVYTRAFPVMRAEDVPFLIYLSTKQLESGVGVDPDGRDRPLSWYQVGEMEEYGATIGAHTHSHPDLRTVSTDQIEEELALSDGLIEKRLGVRPLHFCYPYGFWSQQADVLVRRRYQTATLGGGEPLSESTDPYMINRVPIQLSDGRFFFVRKMRTGMVYEERLRRRIKKYRGP